MVEAGEPEAEVTEATETSEPAESSEEGSTMSPSLFDFDD
jgi:hypothetical protein